MSASSTSFCSGSSSTLTATAGFASYQWYDGDGAILGATSSAYEATSGGTYYVVSTTESSCSVTSSSATIAMISLETPTDLTASDITESSALVSWNNVSPTGVYNVSISLVCCLYNICFCPINFGKLRPCFRAVCFIIWGLFIFIE